MLARNAHDVSGRVERGIASRHTVTFVGLSPATDDHVGGVGRFRRATPLALLVGHDAFHVRGEVGSDYEGKGEQEDR